MNVLRIFKTLGAIGSYLSRPRVNSIFENTLKNVFCVRTDCW